MDAEEIDKLTDLHIEVLKDVLRGDSWATIKSNRQHEFDALNYEEIIIKKAHRLSFNDDGHLIGAYPVSPLPTMHKLTVPGVGTGYAMCAIDALGATHTFDTPVKIESKTTDTGTPVILTISADDVPESDVVVTYKPLGCDSLQEMVAANAQLATDACPAINFYENKDQVPNGLVVLDFQTAVEEAKRIFDREAIRDHIAASIGTRLSASIGSSSCCCST